MSLLIGLDIGTSGAKALLLDPRGTVLASAYEEYAMTMSHPLWAEQNPEDWWRATERVFRRLMDRSRIPAREIKGIGLTGQMHGLVLLDGSGKVLRPCIMWNDQRTGRQCAAITSKIGAQRLLELTGNPVLPGFTAPKVVWVRDEEPDLYRHITRVLLPKDYIRYRLTGEYVTEVSDASGTSLLDVKRRTWSDEVLNALEIPKEWLPSIVESPQVTGKVSPSASRETGLPEGIPIVGGGGDQAAGAVGSGIVRPGVVSVTIGTSGVVFAHSETYQIEPQGRLHAFCHAVPGAWHLMGVTLSAGGSLRWLRDTVCAEEVSKARRLKKDPYELMMAEAAEVSAGSEGLLFLPYLTGERTPYPDPHAKGAFIGLTVRHSKAHLIRSVVEGVSFSLRDCFELIRALGLKVTEIRGSGGGMRSPLWRQILADILGEEIVTLTSTEGAPYGAALLAGVGSGVFKSVTEACDQTVRVVSRTSPVRQHVPLYGEFYQVFHRSYSIVKPLFDSLSEVSR